MKPLNEVLEAINEAVEAYETCKLSLPHHQSEILRSLSVNTHWLADWHVHYKEKWLSVYFNSKGGSSAAKEREADNVVRELYLIRAYEKSSGRVLDSLRSTISINKQNG